MYSKRSSNTASGSSSKQPVQMQQKKTPPELLTYRLDGEMVYVEPPKDYEQALDYAQSVFPALADIPRSRIAFTVNVRVNGSLRKVRIASMAWHRVLQSLSTYEIVDLFILPDNVGTRAAKSETDLATPSQSNATTVASDDAPPKYGSNFMLGDALCTYTFDADASVTRDAKEKPPKLTLQIPGSQNATPSPQVKRCSSALGWFTRRN